MSNLLEAGLSMLKAGLSVLPVNNNKEKAPAVREWKPLRSKPLTEEQLEKVLASTRVKGLGIICGEASGGLEVIDMDLKYDRTGTLSEEFFGAIYPELLDRLVIARTINKGLHIYYRCPKVDSNKKLARRVATKEERKRSPGESYLALLETRGAGGYVVCPPTEGYEFIQGDYSTIQTLTAEQREYLLSLARSFNEVEEEPTGKPIKSTTQASGVDLSPWKDFNLRGSVEALNLLQAKGWTVVKETPERIYLKRPGESPTRYSGNYHKGLNKLYVFSTSTELPDSRPLSNSDIFLQLECNGDTKELSRKLKDMGYGSTDTFNPSTSPTGKAVTVPTPEEEEDEFSSLLRPLTREEIIQEVLKEKDNIPTGFYLKDGNREIELKLPTGGLTIIAGRTSHRKTGTMLNLCREVVDRIGEEGGRVLFLSYEESDMNIQLKLLNLIVNMESLDPTAQLDNKEYIKAYYRGTLEGTEAFRRAEEKFYRDYIDTGRIVVKYCSYKDKKLARAVKYLASKEAYSAIFIDYIQLIRPEELQSKTRQEQLFNICEELREVAVQTRLPLIFGAQFNREVENRTDLDSNKLREAGDIEQTANLVLGLWDNNFNPEGEKVKRDKDGNAKTPPREQSLYIEVLKGRDIGIGWKGTFEYCPPTGALAIKRSNPRRK